MASRRHFGAAAITAGVGVALSRWFSRRDETTPITLKTIEAKIGGAVVSVTFIPMAFSVESRRPQSRNPVDSATLSIKDAPVVIGNLSVPPNLSATSSAIPYQIDIIPSDSKWTLVVRKGLSGALEAEELGRTEMATRKLDASVEYSEWVIEDEALKMRWGTTEASVKIAAS